MTWTPNLVVSVWEPTLMLAEATLPVSREAPNSPILVVSVREPTLMLAEATLPVL